MTRTGLKQLVYVIVCAVFCGWNSAQAGVYEQFHRSVSLDDAPAVSAILARGFDPNTPSERGEPPLVAALRDGQLAVAEVLFRHPDIKVDQPNATNETALMMACLRGLTGWAKRLIDRGASVNRPGWSPILYAATGPDPQLMRMLLASGADLNARNPSGSTALIMAARFGSEDVIAVLLEAGANPRQTNPAGQDAVAAARWAGRDRLADRLEAWGSKR